jgi:FkbM family methyltransferase
MIRQTDNGHWVIDKDTHVGQWVESSGRLDHDTWLLSILFRYVRPGDTVLDVGANIGDHTIAYLDWVTPTGEVRAFEPNPEAYECLIRNCPGAIAYNVGLSDCRDERSLTVDQNAGASHLGTGDGIVCKVQALDDYGWAFYEPVDFIKVDIEGYEVNFLKGARKTILKWHPIMCMEVNMGALLRAGSSEQELLATVESLGYNWSIIQGERNEYVYDILALFKRRPAGTSTGSACQI